MLDDIAKPDAIEFVPNFSVYPASQSEALDLARLAAIASENLCVSTWEELADTNESALEVGKERAARKHGTFSYQNAEIAMQKGKVIGAIISHPIMPSPVQEPLVNVAPYYRPFLELERAAGTCWYVSFLATYKPYRGQGVASALISEVEDRAKAAGFDRLCLIVGDANPARAFYQSLGFKEVSQASAISAKQKLRHDYWVLIEKSLC